MMGHASDDPAVLDLVAAIGRTTTVDEVVHLLRSHWRERAMGAWYALFHQADDVEASLLRSLETSQGTLTAPPLLAATLTLTRERAEPSIRRYLAEDQRQGWGSAGLAAAALQSLDVDDPGEVPQDDRRALDRLLDITTALRRTTATDRR